nr:hypothetical protein [Tanacetum cinerariifolium]
MTTLVGNNSQVPPEALAALAAWVKGQKEFAEEGQSVSSHVLKMKGYIDNLERLCQPVGQNLAVSLILVSMNKDFDSFVQNYNMHGMGKTVNELHVILKLHEETMPKKDVNPALHAIRAVRVQKNQKNKPHKAVKEGHGKGKGKMGYAPNNAPFAPKPTNPPPPKKHNPAKDAIFHQCGEVGHLRRNCPVYLAELMKKKKLSQGASTSGALSLYVGDGHRAAVEEIRSYHLELPSGLVIVLNNYHYAPSITRGVILVSCFFDNGFINRFDDNNVISVSKNNLVYFMAVPRDGIFEIDMSRSNTKDSSMYAVTNKKAIVNLDSSLLWHCHFGHISKKCIEKLQQDGLLNYIDIESLGKYVSCMSGTIARKPYSHQVERAKDLLRLIHTDGYVYLLKHKHEVFETFKDLQKEVENQLGKTIKSLRSDCEGYPKETIGYSFYSPSENKVFVARNAEFFESKLLDLKASGSVEDLELIQEEDTNPSVDTSLNHKDDDQEIDEPQSDINPIRNSSRTCRAPDRMCLYIDAEEHELGDLGEPT